MIKTKNKTIVWLLGQYIILCTPAMFIGAFLASCRRISSLPSLNLWDEMFTTFLPVLLIFEIVVFGFILLIIIIQNTKEWTQTYRTRNIIECKDCYLID